MNIDPLAEPADDGHHILIAIIYKLREALMECRQIVKILTIKITSKDKGDNATTLKEYVNKTIKMLILLNLHLKLYIVEEQ
jgi:hypothetical protein